MATRNSTRESLTAEYLRAVLHYDPETGVFTWKHRAGFRPQWNLRYPGTRAGTVRVCNGRPYLVIAIDKVMYRAHRLAWLYMTGEWPKGRVDHRNNDSLANWWTNLREGSQSQNMANARRPRTNSSGVKGVHRSKCGKFDAAIGVRGRKIHIGRFETLDAAAEAYKRAAIEHYGDFARTE